MRRPDVSSARWVAVGMVVTMIATPAAAAAATVVYLKLNTSNTASAATSVTGQFNDRVLRLANNGIGSAAGALGAFSKSGTGATINATNGGGGPALSLAVPAGKAPMRVSPGATKVANLDADKLDGLDATAFARIVGVGSTDILEIPGDGNQHAYASVTIAVASRGFVAVTGGVVLDNVACGGCLVFASLRERGGSTLQYASIVEVMGAHDTIPIGRVFAAAAGTHTYEIVLSRIGPGTGRVRAFGAHLTAIHSPFGSATQ